MLKELFIRIQETSHLLKSTKNAKGLLRFIDVDQANNGEFQEMVD